MKKQVGRNLEQCRMFRGPWKGGRESDGWFIDVPQVYYLGRKEQGRKRPGPKSPTTEAESMHGRQLACLHMGLVHKRSTPLLWISGPFSVNEHN